MEGKILRLIYISIILAIGYYIFPYIIPFLLALTLAIVVEPVVNYLAVRFKLSRVQAVTVNFLLFLLVGSALIFLGMTKIITEIIGLLKILPPIISDLGADLGGFILQAQLVFADLPPELIKNLNLAVEQLIGSGNKLVSELAQGLVNAVIGIPNALVIIILVVVSFYFFSLQLYELREGLLELFSEKAKEKVDIILKDVNAAIVGFVRAQLIISFLTYMVVLGGLLILQVQYAMAVALLIVVVDILPILGTGAVIIPWSIVLFALGAKFVPIGLLVLYVVIIAFRRVVEPKILAQNIGLNALTIIISMYVGFKLLGIVGLFVAPLVFIIFKALRKAGLFKIKIDF